MKNLHIIFKTHLDVGYTDLASKVIDNYIEFFIPKALENAETMNRESKKFIWTTGSYLIHKFLQEAEPQNIKRLERAIENGDITWHAMPFTTHSELMDKDLFRLGLNISRELDKRFGKKTISAKLTDVPGHTKAIIPLLKEAGVEFLHIGVNPACVPPDVPDIFRWRHNNDEIITLYDKGYYGGLSVIDDMESGLCFAHTNDNVGPQGIDELETLYGQLNTKYPNCNIFASDLNKFAQEVLASKLNLQTIENEIGDTWIHGAGSDPKKIAGFREKLRRKQYSEDLLLVAEHTCGISGKDYLKDLGDYSQNYFKKHCKDEDYLFAEKSWQEQRDYIDDYHGLIPEKADVSGLLEVHPNITVTDSEYKIRFDETGAISYLERKGKTIFNENHLLGGLVYYTYSAGDFRRFKKDYVTSDELWADWDLTKRGMKDKDAESLIETPKLMGIYRKKNTFYLKYQFDISLNTHYGCYREAEIEVTLGEVIHYIVKLFDRNASKLPQAYFVRFNPVVADAQQWKITKIGEEISPFNVINNGANFLHAIEDDVYNEGLRITAFDTPLVGFGENRLMNFANKDIDMRCGITFNLYNNIWNTNFPFWYRDDILARFKISF